MSNIYIKNMVCDRCIMVVKQALGTLKIPYEKIDLGEVFIRGELAEDVRLQLKNRLEAVGFELLDDRRHQLIDQIKSALIKLVHRQDNRSNQTMSDYLTAALHQDYSSLSKLFSEVEGKTLEHYFMELKIERVKELIKYDELTLTQIALRLNYSSTAYLSSQFKSITGMTPTQFKNIDVNLRKGLDKL